MPIVIENIDQYIIYVQNNNLVIETKYLIPDEKKKMDDMRKKIAQTAKAIS